jgi:CRP-like cAMP-binding protein
MGDLMTTFANSHHPLENRILAALSTSEYERLLPHLEEVSLKLGEVLSRPNEPLDYVYFPHRGTISAVVLMEDGAEAEIGIVGNEGMYGLSVILGTDTSPLQAIVQVPDGATRMKVSVLKAEVGECSQLFTLLLSYTQAFFIQAAQTAACNRLHKLSERLARWLLTCQDRAKTDELHLTHEFMAIMLGVRRAGVTEAANEFQDIGCISYHRGHITILDRQGLEALTCECYEIVKKEYARLLR